ncbi:uncharacterized protein [Cardiocondyla obscurior]|uniref:uncharacterized protein n=1 Tax=Cardiocondyla obscurior TaxID=286306 RepID=UPI0039657314
MILPRNSHLTGLIIASCHFRVLHGGVQQTLGLLRRQYWIPGGRAAVKRHVHKCSQCVRWRAAAPHQIMADLPSARVTPSRTFQHTGVDYAGPIFIRSSKGRGHKSSKAFISVFICLSTRAVHLDVASDYSSEAFLAAFRRFTARRGLPQIMYSDCGTNFTGADAELQKLFRASSRESAKIHHALAGKGVEWRFNPPAAPHFGGLWEAAVKSVKHHLRRVLGTATLTYEEMHAAGRDRSVPQFTATGPAERRSRGCGGPHTWPLLGGLCAIVRPGAALAGGPFWSTHPVASGATDEGPFLAEMVARISTGTVVTAEVDHRCFPSSGGPAVPIAK